MDFNPTFTNSKGRAQSGTTLVDVMLGSALASLVLAVLAMLMVFGSRSFVAMANYVILDQRSRNSLDQMSKEIRQCNRLLTSNTNFLEFENFDGGNLRYEYSPTSKTLFRSRNGVKDQKALLEGCNYLKFAIYQRNPLTNGVYGQYPTASAATCKLVQLSWVCARPILGGQNTESVQSAKVVIRNQ